MKVKDLKRMLEAFDDELPVYGWNHGYDGREDHEPITDDQHTPVFELVTKENTNLGRRFKENYVLINEMAGY
jgi:hypothetical protein